MKKSPAILLKPLFAPFATLTPGAALPGFSPFCRYQRVRFYPV